VIKQLAAISGMALAVCTSACDYDWSTPPALDQPDAQATQMMAVMSMRDAGAIHRVPVSKPQVVDAGHADACGDDCDAGAAPVCPDQHAPDHGTLERKGEDARFGCDPGYVLHGARELTCRADGNWSAAAPSCDAVSCGALSDPKDGSVSLSGTSFGDLAEYACNAGTVLVGTAKRACQADGHWTGDAPSCACSSDLLSDAKNCGMCGVSCSSNACAAGQCVRRVFLSSTSYAPNFGSATKADDSCQRAADAAKLGGMWKAWMSDATSSPSTRFTKGMGEYRRIDGMKVADNYADLTDGTLQNPINVTETGHIPDSSILSYVYTGTMADGTPVMLAPTDPNAVLGATCQNWTTSLAAAWGAYGTYTTVAASWSYANARLPCTSNFPIYCVEQ
jgi:hypothetical protein